MKKVDDALKSGAMCDIAAPYAAFTSMHDAHMKAEEAVICPAYESLIDDAAKAKLESSDAEVSKLLTRVKEMEHAKDYANFATSWKQLVSCLTDHFTQEEALAISKIGASPNAADILASFKRELAKSSSCSTAGCTTAKGASCDQQPSNSEGPRAPGQAI